MIALKTEQEKKNLTRAEGLGKSYSNRLRVKIFLFYNALFLSAGKKTAFYMCPVLYIYILINYYGLWIYYIFN